MLSAEVLSGLFWLPPESAGGLMSPPSRGLAAFGLALAARIGAWGAGAIAVRAALLSATTAAAD